MKLLLIFMACLFTSCASLTPSNLAPVIKAAASVASSQTLSHISNVDQRKEVAAYLWSIAKGARVISGTVPTLQEVEESLSAFTGNEPELANLVVTLAELYADYAPEDVKQSAVILEAIAKGVESAASRYK